MATPSKRSQVSKLDTIKSNQPVAKTVDTFVSYRPPAKDNSASELLDALSSFAPALGKYAKGKREALNKAEENQFDKDFLTSPTETMKKFQEGGYKDLLTVSQIHAGEQVGTALAGQYGSYIADKYAKSGLQNSENPADFDTWLNETQATFVSENKDVFSRAGVVTGFAGSARGYVANLRQQNVVTAATNLDNGQKNGFKAQVTTAIDNAVLNEKEVTPILFGKQIQAYTKDANTATNRPFTDLNTLTLETIQSYLDSDIPYSSKLRVLDLAYSIPTGSGNLGNTIEARKILGKARQKAIKAEDTRLHSIARNYNQRTKIVKEETQGFIINKLIEKPETDIENILTKDQLKEADELYPTWRRFAADQKNFFEADSIISTDPKTVFDMRVELGKITTKQEALSKVHSWASSNKIVKGDSTTYKALLSQASGITKNTGNWHTDELYKKFYSNFPTADAAVLQQNIQVGQTTTGVDQGLKQAENRIRFTSDFIDLYYGENNVEVNGELKSYSSLTTQQQLKAVQRIYNEVINPTDSN